MRSNNLRGYIVATLVLMVIGVVVALPLNPVVRAGRVADTLLAVEASDGASGDLFGGDVAVSGDLMAVGARWADDTRNDQGAVYLFERDAAAPTGWTEFKKITVELPEVGEEFGTSVALDGDVLAVGAPDRNGFGVSEQGAVYLYERDHGGADTWGLSMTLTEPLPSFSYFGSDVALDGGTLVVGARSTNGIRGAAFVYDRATAWGKVKELSDPSGVIADYFGESVAIDGDTIVVGQPMKVGNTRPDTSGAAFVFGRDQDGPDAWGQVARLVADVPEPLMEFGDQVALDGDTVVVGAINTGGDDSTFEPPHGAAFVFERDQGGPDAWGMTKRLVADEAAPGDRFGSALALAGDDLWVGAEGADGDFTNQGAVYHYGRDHGGAGTWGEAARIEVEDGLPNDSFGSALALDGAAAMVGANGRDASRGVVYVAGEDTTPSPTPSLTRVYLPHIGNDTFAKTGTLADGTSVAATTGARLGAATGTLDTPVDVRMLPVAPPSILPDAGVVRGEYHAVAAARPLAAAADKPLVVGLPVPDGANPDDLALAVLLPTDQIDDGAGDTAVWRTVPGRYDPDSDLFVVTLAALTPDDVLVVLVEHPQFEPLPSPTGNLRAAAPAQTALFEVRCDVNASPAICTDAAKNVLAAELESAYTVFVTTHGFREPRLIKTVALFGGTGSSPTVEVLPVFHGITIVTESDPCDTVEGEYITLAHTIRMCMTATTTGEQIRPFVRHELFHAIQRAYPAMLDEYINGGRERWAWTTEGTATAAERSGAIMLGSLDFVAHTVSDSLLDITDDREYSAQDFWVYAGLELDEPISYLRTVFESGGTPERVSAVLNLQDLYWKWAKNQAFEKEHFVHDDMQFGPCEIEPSLIGTPIAATWPADNSVDDSLPPMTSRVVEWSFARTMEIGTLAVTSSNDDAVRYKLYPVRDAPDPDCATQPDGDGEETGLFFFSRHKLYVLISNTSPTDTHTFDMALSGG
jgi:hypothetical protein